jgi:PEP-CTERM motif
MRRVLKIALATAAAFAATTPAMAAVTFGGSSGSLAATATFDIVGGNLMVTLTNTASGDINVPADILHAVFFDVAGTPSLNYNDADICGTCSFTGAVLGSGTDVGAEWAFGQNASGLGGGVTQDYGLSSAGYGLFGPGDVLSGAAHPDRGGATVPPDGGDFGLVSAGYTTSGDNGGVTNSQPYIKNSATFNLGAFNGSLGDIGNIRFQYGTSLDDTHFGAVPEPGTWALMLLGFGGIGMAMRRSRRRTGALMQIA